MFRFQQALRQRWSERIYHHYTEKTCFTVQRVSRTIQTQYIHLCVCSSVCRTPVLCRNGWTHHKAFYPSGSHTILVFHAKPYGSIPTIAPTGDIECRGIWKNRDFQPLYVGNDRALVTNRNSYAIYRIVPWCHFQWPLMTHNPDFKVAPLFDTEYLNSRTR